MRFALFAAVAAGFAAAQNPAGSIEGVVIDALTRTPVRGAVVYTWALPGMPHKAAAAAEGAVQPVPVPQPRQIVAKTDASGAFALRDLPAGAYRLTVTHTRYPQLSGPSGKQVELTARETARVVVELTPGATLSGRVVDEDGDPLAGCAPRLLPARAGQPVTMIGSEPTDATGTYSIQGIAPGKYKLMIRCSAPVLEPFPLHPVTEPAPAPTVAYPPVFYPGVTDSQQAQLVEVSAGIEKTALDFQMKPARVFTVNGILRALGADFSKASLSLSPRKQFERESFGGFGASVNRAKGTFRFQGVFPGSYTVAAFMAEDGGPRYGARQDVDVPASAPLELELKPGMDVIGKIEVEGEFKQSLRSVVVQLVPTEAMGLGTEPPKTGEDGAFTIRGVLPGVYRVEAWGPNVFAKSVSWGGDELPDSLLDTNRGGAGPMRVLLSTKTATIKGTAPPDRLIEMMAESSTDNLRVGAMADAQGTFTFGGLRPGKYRVALAGATDETPGEDVTVQEGESVTVTLRDPGRP